LKHCAPKLWDYVTRQLDTAVQNNWLLPAKS
jgi:putative hydrolase of HD superfamily